MYESFRYAVRGDVWGYDIPVSEPGLYACTVHFAETLSEAFFKGARVFDLTIAADGAPLLFKNIDVFKVLGGARFTVYTRTALSLSVSRGISFRLAKSPGSKLPPFMSGITCERKFHSTGGDPVKKPASSRPSSIATGGGRSTSKKRDPSALAIAASSAVGLIVVAAGLFLRLDEKDKSRSLKCD